MTHLVIGLLLLATTAAAQNVAGGSGPNVANVGDDVADVTLYGAVADDAVDDATAIQAAITAACAATTGRRVFIPAGTFRIGATLTVASTCDGLILYGAGRGVTTLKVKDDPEADDFGGSCGGAPSANPCNLINIVGDDVTVRDLTIDGNRGTNANSLRIEVITTGAAGGTSAARPTFARLEIKDLNGYGLHLYRTYDGTIRDVIVRSTGDAGSTGETDGWPAIRAEHSMRTLIDNVRVIDASEIAISVTGSSGGTTCGTDMTCYAIVSNSLIENPGTIGIYGGQRSWDLTIANNVVEGGGVTHDCIDTGTGARIAISGNVLRDCDAGIVLSGSTLVDAATNVAISGNTITDSSTGITVVGKYLATVAITGNVVDSIQTYGIGVTNGDNIVIADNSITDVGLDTGATAGDRSAVKLETTATNAMSDVTIANNRGGNVDAGTMLYGVNLANNTTLEHVHIHGNNFRGAINLPLLTSGTPGPGIVFRDNDPLAGNPVACSANFAGSRYYNTADNEECLCNGTAWLQVDDMTTACATSTTTTTTTSSTTTTTL